MNSIVVLYEHVHHSQAKNPLLEIAFEVAVELAMGTEKMEIEGCKNCNILWFDKLEDIKLTGSGSRLLSDEER